LLADLPAPDVSESPTQIMPITAPLESGVGRIWRPRRGPIAAAAAVVVLVAAWSAWHFRSHPRPTAPSASASVAVLPFRYGGSDQYRYLGDGMVELLSAKLDHAGELRAIDPRAVAG